MKPQKPVHRLSRVEITLDLPEPKGSDTATVSVVGRSSTKRADLWRETEAWSPTNRSPGGMEVADWIGHFVLVALQDRPNSSERLIYALTGGLGKQDPLF